jgi:hypothetical protein
VKLRLEEAPEECQQAVPRLAEVFNVVSASDLYPNRGPSMLVWVYVEVRLGHERDGDQDDTTAPHGSRSIGPGGSCPGPLTLTAKHSGAIPAVCQRRSAVDADRHGGGVGAAL